MIINFINTHLVDLWQASTVRHLKKEEAHMLVKMQGKHKCVTACFSFLFLPFMLVSKTPSAPLTPLVSALIGDK